MTWNYRVIKKIKDKKVYCTFAEVYYDDNGNIVGWFECKKETFISEDFESLKEDVSYLFEALKRPVLIEDENKLIDDKI